jgi:spermidine/putrescine transport system permease protein
VATTETRRSRRARTDDPSEGVWYPKWFWPAFVLPGLLILILLFVLPFYVILGVVFGKLDPILQTPVLAWSPAQWDRAAFGATISELVSADGLYREAFVRTLWYVGVATSLCLLIGYPFAYFVARHAGKYKVAFLVAFFVPFWISYMMRMTAWVNILQDNGYVNRVLSALGLMPTPYQWLSGKSITVILGLVYGYIPLMVLPLYAVLDRIPQSHLEGARDLGASPAGAFRRVTLPSSTQGILAGVILCALPMFGDYFTNRLLADTSGTRMIGNWIVDSLQVPIFVPRGAALSLIVLLLLIIPIIYYLRSTRRAAQGIV